MAQMPVHPEHAAAARDDPRRQVDPSSMLSAAATDPLGLILSFALIDLPVARGQPYFPKELVRIVREYASDLSFVVEFECGDQSDVQSFVVLDSTAQLVQWLARRLPHTVDAPSDDLWARVESDDDSLYAAHCDSCLADEAATIKYGADISRLLHAQLEPHEYRMCVFDTHCDEDGCPFDPEEYIHEDSDGEEELPFDLAQHRRFCLDQLDKRKAAIAARGQEPVPVGMRELLERVRSTLKAGKLPRGLSPRPCDWAPLFGWIRSDTLDLNNWLRQSSFREPSQPLLCAVLLQSPSTKQAASVVHQTYARLWAHDPTLPVLCKGAESMMIADEPEDAQESAAKQSAAVDSASSSASSSSAAARPSS